MRVLCEFGQSSPIQRRSVRNCGRGLRLKRPVRVGCGNFHPRRTIVDFFEEIPVLVPIFGNSKRPDALHSGRRVNH
jgi:hypothetical protein